MNIKTKKPVIFVFRLFYTLCKKSYPKRINNQSVIPQKNFVQIFSICPNPEKNSFCNFSDKFSGIFLPIGSSLNLVRL